MRLRHIKNADLKLKEYSDYLAFNFEEYKERKSSLNKDNLELRVEIGCGKGKFIYNLAKLNPHIFFIAIEKFDSVILKALEKNKEERLNNLFYIMADASNISDYFDHEISVLYLNFSDPWPKNRNSKRRLTSPLFLNSYKKILAKDGKIIQKTDNRNLFEYSLMMFNNNGFVFENLSLDLHKTDIFNIKTEFEEKWEDKGPIYYLEAKLSE